MEPIYSAEMLERLCAVCAALDTLCWNGDVSIASPQEKLELAEVVQALMGHSFAIAAKLGLTDGVTIDLYSSNLRGKPLMPREVIRQMLGSSSDDACFADDLAEFVVVVRAGGDRHE